MNKKLMAKLAFVQAAALGMASTAMAALPEGTDTKVAEGGTDVVTAIGYCILAGIGIYCARLVGRKMGWL